MTGMWVVSACRNRLPLTRRFLDQLEAQSLKPERVIMVDDGSTDGTTAMLAGETRLPLLTLAGNGHLYWGGSLALALRTVAQLRPPGGAVICLCNDDVTITPDFLAHANAAMRPGCMLLATGVDPSGVAQPERGCVLDWRMRPCPPVAGQNVRCAPTRGLFVRWADVLRVGNIAGSRLPHYHSDFEWTMRATARGLHIITDPSVQLMLEPAATGTHARGRVRGLAAWRQMCSRTYSANPRDLIRFAAMAAPWPIAALELLRQLARLALLPCRL